MNLIKKVMIKETTLNCNSIHCPSCVLLLEKSLAENGGVKSVRVNLTKKRIKIKWDDEEISVNEIINKIKSLGLSTVADNL